MRVLVVDDSLITRGAIGQELRNGGYVIEEAATGAEALERILARPPDIVTLDVELPDMSGFDVCLRLRTGNHAKAIAEIPVVFVTANDTLEGRARGFEVGGTDFVTKGESTSDILIAVNRILRPSQQLRETTALVVDDSEISRALLIKHLAEHGVTVLEARDGDEGLRIISDRPNDVDLVITDMRMPNMNGDELCRQIRKTLGLAHVPIIIVSVVDDIDSVLDVFKVGATDYLMKPYIKEELIARLNSHLHVRQLNKRLSQRLEELSRLNRIKDRFLSICSENMRPPMNTVVNTLDEIVRTGEMSEAVRKELRQVKAQSTHVLSLITNFLGNPDRG